MLQLYRRINSAQVIENLNFNRYSIMSLGMLIHCCTAGIAIYELFKFVPNDFQLIPLAVVAMACMGANALAIAIAPIKWVIGGFLISLATSIMVILYATTFMLGMW